MKKMKESAKAKMKPVSLTNEEDTILMEIGGGSRTAGLKALMELHRILKKIEVKDPQELKYKLAAMVEAYNQK